jgi:toxin ParE1/3/4
VAGFRLSGDAYQDIKEIYRFSLESFGQARADRYVAGLEDCLTLLASNPLMGRDFGQIRTGLRRHEHQGHVVYYREDGSDILILRILGTAQDPGRHL